MVVLLIILWGLFLISLVIHKLNKEDEAENKTEYSNSFETTYYIESENDVIYNYYKAFSYPKDFVVFDLETTGLSPACEEIIEIGAIKYVDGIEKDRFITYVKPTKHIPYTASKINGIYDADVANAPKFKDIAKSFIDFVGDYTLIAHNASFDMRFIQTQLYKYDFPLLDNFVIDTLSLAQRYIDNVSNHKLETLKHYLNINLPSHRAIDDCAVTGTLYLHLLKFISPNINLTTEQNSYYEEIKKILSNSNKKICYIQPLVTTNYLQVICCYNLIKIKLGGRLQYALLDIPFEDFSLPPSCNLKISIPSNTEGSTRKTRLHITSPNDIKYISEYLCNRYDYCLKEARS